MTKRYAEGRNGVVLFFALVAISLWLKYLTSERTTLVFTLPASLELLGAGAAMAGGYALWNLGILRGNLTLMASASYFTPVLSSLFAMIWLTTPLGSAFWQGVAMVTGGSLLCWLATRELSGAIAAVGLSQPTRSAAPALDAQGGDTAPRRPAPPDHRKPGD